MKQTWKFNVLITGFLIDPIEPPGYGSTCLAGGSTGFSDVFKL